MRETFISRARHGLSYTGAMAETARKLRHDLGFWFLRMCLGGGSRLPLGLLRPIGHLTAKVALRMVPRDRRRATEHLRIAFPDLSEGQRLEIMHQTVRHLGQSFAEIVWLWRARPDEVDRICSIEGIEHLETARSEGHGAVLVTAHCGNWELLNARLGTAGIPMTIAVREIYDSRIDPIATALRARFGAEIVPRGMNAGKRLSHALLSNRVNGLLIDQDIRSIPGVFVPFFGRPAWTPVGAAALALKIGCPVTPAFIHRDERLEHHVRIYPPLAIPEGGSEEERLLELTAAATMAIERQIRAHPEQWVWMHRRWRTRPETISEH